VSGTYTRLGSRLWNWEPFTDLDPLARILWLALYTSTEAKRVLPGLFHGSINAMSDAAKLQPEDTRRALDMLLESKLVEYDQKNRVLRFTKLPDAGEYPSNPSIMKAWWKRFQDLPMCEVRDAHVPVLRWILERGAAEAEKNLTKRPTPAHEQQWSTTFGTVQVPAPRRRGLRRLLDDDTSTPDQPSLFGRGPDVILPTIPSSGSDSVTYENPGSERVPPPSGEGERVGVGSFFSSGSACPMAPEPPGDRDLEAPTRPHLALVPGPQPYGWVLDQLAAASNGRYQPAVRDGLHAALHATMRDLSAAQVGPEQIAVVARWRGLVTEISTIGGDPRSRLSVWVSGEGNVLAALKAATEHEHEAREASAHLAELKKQLGY
jgi:hypothetical protein